MGLYNITYKNKETEKEINAEMGKPFGLIEKLRLGGIGSRRMIIENFSEDLKNLALKVSGIPICQHRIKTKWCHSSH